jgi:hypothetical protein
MSVHKPKFKNIPIEKVDRIVKHHLPYELWMMRDSLVAALKGASTRFQQNLQVEVFALHCRNLIEFLKGGDACAFNPADFTSHGFSVNRKFIRPRLIDKINEQISHLTNDRTENPDEKFNPDDWKETAAAIENEFSRWVKNLTPDWAKKWEQRERIGEHAAPTATLRVGFGGATNVTTSTSTSVGFGATDPASEDK